MRNVTIGALKFNDIVVTDVDLSDYLPLSGGTITGDIDILDAYLSVNSPDSVIFAGDNSTLAGELYKKQDAVLKSPDGVLTPHVTAVKAAHYGFSLSTNAVGDQHATLYFPIISGDATIATTTDCQNYLDKRTGGIIDGNLSVLSSIGSGENSYAAGLNSAAFGEAVSALADASFAEGRQTLANDKYAHAEGSKTKALGERSHAEGAGTVAYGWGSHVEGEETSALWRAGHAEGKKTVAYMYSHAEGSETLAGYDLTAANAEGQGDVASHAEGYQTSAIARFSHAEGYGSIAGISDPTTRPMKGSERNFDIDQAAHAEGHDTSALGHASHAEGRSTIAKGDQSHAGGKYSIVNSSNSFAHGLSCFIDTNASESFAFGLENNIYGNGSKMFAIGSRNTISATGEAHTVFVGGLGNTVNLVANGPSFIYGRNNRLANSGLNFIAGENLSCNHNFSILLGTNAESKQQRQFVWSGTSNKYTPLASTGTFNINPANGINGFYIGQDNFVQCVVNAVQAIAADSTKKAALKAALQTILA